MTTRPNVLVIGGYDQSGGAGVLADVKTMEAHGVYAYAVITGLTYQNERTIRRVQWLPEEDIREQIELCWQSTPFEWAKIGVGWSLPMIEKIILYLRELDAGIRIVLDPVIRSSSGHDFWQGAGMEDFESVARLCYLVTPNWDEIGWLYPGQDVMECCRKLTAAAPCAIYLKGGHHPSAPGRDYLWREGSVRVLEPIPGSGPFYPKHGSGCVMASSLTADLALGYGLMEAAVRSKWYIEKFLGSNKSLLGWHSPL